MRAWIKQIFAAPPGKSEEAGKTNIADLMLRGQQEFERGNLAEAARHYQEVVANDRLHADAYCQLGFALKGLGRFEEAAHNLARAVEIDPQLVDAHFVLGELAQAGGNHDAANRHWRAALSIAPDFEAPYLCLCQLLLQQGKLQDALHVVEGAIEHLPQSPDLHFYLGNLQYETQQFPAAADSLRRAFALAPERAEIGANLGLALIKLEDFDTAAAVLEKTLTLNSNLVEARDNLANIYLHQGNLQHQLGDWANAARRYEKSLAVHPAHLASCVNLGSLLQMQNRHDEAASVYRAGLAALPNHTGLLIRLGTSVQAQGRLEEAVEYYEIANTLEPDNVDARYNLAVASYSLGRHDAAIALYRSVLLIDPKHLESRFNLAHALQAQKEWDESEVQYRKVLEIQADHFDTCMNLGLLLQSLGRLDEALASYRHALRVQPGDYRALINIGNALQEQSLTDDAFSAYKDALASNPLSLEARTNISSLLNARHQFDEAIAYCDEILAIRPDHPEAHLSKAISLLSLGRLAEGWREYEHRWQSKDADPKPAFSQREWDGRQSLAGKTILLYAEQGLGDTLQFIRYASLVAERGAVVHVLAPQPLHALLARCHGVAKVFAQGQPPGSFDYQCALMSLPALLGTELSSIPSAVPYLASSQEKNRHWQDRLGRKHALRVGLAWAGSPRKHQHAAWATDRMRSLRFEQITPLLDVAGVEFFSLQLGEEAVAQLNGDPRVIDLTADLHDFEDTAALISNLDLVISVDTSVVHLAGAIGKPVWVLNRYNTCWRWLTGRNDSPWYPTARIFRQPSFGDWASVIAEAREALLELAIANRPDERI